MRLLLDTDKKPYMGSPTYVRHRVRVRLIGKL